MPLDQLNRVIVRVWTSEENKLYPGNNVGHISIETSREYMSLWPIPFTKEQRTEYSQSKSLNQKYLKYFMERDPKFHVSYRDDYIAEGGIEPQVTICFYSLDTHKMIDKFDTLKTSTDSWRLIGSNMLVEKLAESLEEIKSNLKFFESTKKSKYKENCASLALKILIAGKIADLLDSATLSSFGTKTSSAVSPDNLLDVLIPAKKRELSVYPETKEFRSIDETIIEPDIFTGKCNIM